MVVVGSRARRTRRVFLAGFTTALLGGAMFAASALAVVPAVVTGAASSVTYDSAVVSASVNPHSSATVVYFQYGTTDKYGAQSAPTEIAAGAKAVPISITLSGLTAATVYHYRIVATNASGTALGADRAVATAKIPLALAITAAPNPVAVGGPVTLEGTLSGTGSANAPVVLASARAGLFCAGADIKAFAAMDEPASAALIGAMNDLLAARAKPLTQALLARFLSHAS